ncbi:hypothetical protein KEJ49_06610 [Candidatus Bathyarchaeota archaeon]|nr:hypothetical protein [Candidatus Bathyarchaeota archaeon]
MEDEEDKVNAFIDLASERRPEGAEVEGIEIKNYDGKVIKIESYYRYLTAMQLSKIATHGGILTEKQEQTIKEVKGLKKEFRDYREEFRGFADKTRGDFKSLFERYGEISDKFRTGDS